MRALRSFALAFSVALVGCAVLSSPTVKTIADDAAKCVVDKADLPTPQLAAACGIAEDVVIALLKAFLAGKAAGARDEAAKRTQASARIILWRETYKLTPYRDAYGAN